MTMVDERRVQAMPGHESTETGSDGLVIALGPKQLACVLAVARSGGSRSPVDRDHIAIPRRLTW